MRLARVLGAIGRTLVTAGTLILLFVAYQLWGTGFHEARAQDRLEESFEERLAAVDATLTGSPAGDGTPQGEVGEGPGEPDPTSSSTTTTATTVPTPPPPEEGEGVAALRIPDIGVEKIVVEGVRLSDLKDGPGHYPETPMPGNAGNAAIAGHRTTYGAPFHRIDELEPGDEILVTTLQGEFRYEVMPVRTGETAGDGSPEVVGHSIVAPGRVEVLADHGDDRLTLTACHPKYSAAQRIIVAARLVDEPAPPAPEPPQPEGDGQDAPVRDGEPSGSIERAEPRLDLDGEGAPAWPAILWGSAAGLVWVGAWLIGRRWRKWPGYLIASPLFLVLLYAFFENFSRLLPANY